jgi:hypothetical protein
VGRRTTLILFIYRLFSTKSFLQRGVRVQKRGFFNLQLPSPSKVIGQVFAGGHPFRDKRLPGFGAAANTRFGQE